MLDPWKVLKEYRITEKSNALASLHNCYTFEVAPGANRLEVAFSVEKAFKVKVKEVRLLNRKPKIKVSRMRRSLPGKVGAMKKAMVTLEKGYKIEMI